MLSFNAMRFFSKATGRRRIMLSAASFVALLVAAKMLNTSPLTNSASTDSNAAPELKTRVYAPDVARVYAAAQSVITEQKTWFKSWRVVNGTQTHAESQAHAGPQQCQLDVEVPVLFFTDDVKISISAGAGGTQVDVESRSRVGQGDFGENRRHIVQFLKALDEKLDEASA